MRLQFVVPVVGLIMVGCQPAADLAAPLDEAGPSFGVVTAGGPDAYRINGFGHQGSGNTIRTFSLTTAIAWDGTVSGTFNLHARAAGVTVRGFVTCATVFGRAAWMGGTITSPEQFEGRDAVFRVVDTGAGTKGEFEDLVSFLQPRDPGMAQEYCDTTPSFPNFFGAQGNITVATPTRSSFTTVDRVDLIDRPVWIPCALNGAGELVLLSGTALNMFHVTEDRAGGTTVRYQFNPQDVSGFGQTSGDSYQGTGGSNGHTTWTISGVPFTDTFVDNFRVIGQGSGNNLLVQVRGQFHVNANGEVTVSDFRFSETCT